MKKFICFLILVIILVLTILFKNEIVRFFMIKFVDKNIEYSEKNDYYKDYDYSFVQNTTTLFPKNKQEVLNIIYTTLNRGLEEITFYCDYNECINDINKVAEDKEQLSSINNLVHPYNSYQNIYFSITSYGRINITVKKLYSNSEILLINNKIKEISDNLFDENTSNYDKIKLFHDYIINNTEYDSTVSIESQFYSDTNANKATGLLFEKKAVCSGYSDTMAIFINKLNINNYKINSEQHIWNLVYIDNEWKNIDATWDDPVTSDGRSILIHDFFMIDTNTLFEKEQEFQKDYHKYNTEIYKEAN